MFFDKFIWITLVITYDKDQERAQKLCKAKWQQNVCLNCEDMQEEGVVG